MLRVNSENNFALNKEIVITLHPTLKSDLESVRKNAILGQFIWTQSPTLLLTPSNKIICGKATVLRQIFSKNNKNIKTT